MREDIRRMRVQHPGWGPDTLLIELERLTDWRKEQCPSRSRVAAFLKQEGLTRRYQKHTQLPQPDRQQPREPHQEWEMDAQGPVKVEGLGKTSTINIVDVASRLKVESYPCVGTSKPGAADFILALRRAFLNFGLPQRLSLDRDAAFIQNTSTSPFPMPIHLWLIALGIDVVFTRKRRPTDHAIVERHHQTMEAQVLKGQHWASPESLWQAFDERRQVLNDMFPTRALGGRAPIEVFPAAKHSGRLYRPEWETELLSIERVYEYLAEGRWFRRIGDNGHFHIGGQMYYIGNRYARREVELLFDPEEAAFICRPEGIEDPIIMPARGLTKADLMGNLADLLHLPSYQLALPFTRENRLRLNLVQCWGDTTFRDNRGTIK
jgi:hypothetical protein